MTILVDFTDLYGSFGLPPPPEIRVPQKICPPTDPWGYKNLLPPPSCPPGGKKISPTACLSKSELNQAKIELKRQKSYFFQRFPVN